MDFCVICGFLLPIEFVGKTDRCRTCRSRIETERNRVDAACQCEYCRSPFANGQHSTKSLEAKDDKELTSNSDQKKPTNARTAKHARSHKIIEQAMEVDDDVYNPSTDWSTACLDWGADSDTYSNWYDQSSADIGAPFQSQPQRSKKAKKKNSSRLSDGRAPAPPTNLTSISKDLIEGNLNSQSLSSALLDSGDFDLDLDDDSNNYHQRGYENVDDRNFKDWGDYSMGEDDFYIDTHDNLTDSKKKSPDFNIFGDHDFPTLQKNLKEGAVKESVRADWERQQREYKQKLILQDTPGIARLISGKRRKEKNGRYYVGGVDISFIKDNPDDACACLSIVRLPDLELVYQAMEMIKLTQLYIPGFLAFREVPPLMTLFHKLEKVAPQYTPDVIMVDGNGILHPRGFGLASQLGVLLDKPTIGVAKTLMSAQGVVDDASHKLKKQKLMEAGEGFDLISQETSKVMGKCVRVHDGAPNPVYVSVGHKISLKSAVWLVLECSKYRIPEPIRRADLDSREYIRQGKKNPSVFIM